MSKNFTPAPWITSAFKITPQIAENFRVGSVHWGIANSERTPTNPEGIMIAMCGEDPISERAVADIKLIQSAPDMWALIKGRRILYMPMQELAKEVERIIKKVEG